MPKRNSRKKPSVKVQDLRAKKSPKGGAIYIKFDGVSGESLDAKHKGEIAFDKVTSKVSVASGYDLLASKTSK